MRRLTIPRLDSIIRGKKRWVILLAGLIAGIGLGLLNAVGVVILDRKADAWAEGAILILLTLILVSLWMEQNALHASERRARLLGELSAAVNTPYKTVEILQAAVTNLVQIMDVDAGGIGLLDKDDETFVVIQAEHLKAGMEGSMGKRIVLEPSQAPWAGPLWQGEMVNIPDVDRSAALEGIREIFQRRGTRTLLVLPLFADGRLYGSLGLHSRSKRSFAQDELGFVRSAAAIVTNAVAKAERLAQAQRRAAHLAVADAVAQRLLATNEIKNLPQQVAETLSRYFPAWNIYIFIKQPDRDTLDLAGLSSAYPLAVEKGRFSLSLDEGLTGQAYRDGEVVLVKNVLSDPRYVPGDPESSTLSELVIPVLAGREVVGVLDFQSRQADDFTREDISTLKNVALDVGTALVNAQLVDKARQHRATMERLQSVTKQALAADSLDDMLPALCAATAEAANADQASIMLVDPHGYCHHWVGHNYPARLGPHLVRPDGVSMSVLRSGQARFIPDLLQAQDTVNPGMIAEGLRAAACLPLGGRGELSGVLWINFRSTHDFAQGEQAILETFATQAGLIIEQLTQLESARRRLWELESLQALSVALRQATDPAKMLNALLDTALAVFGVSHGSILLPDPGGESLHFVASRGWTQEVAHLHLPVQGSLSGRAFRSNSPILSPDIMQEPEFSPQVAENIGSNGFAGMFAPIKDETQIVGVIFVGCDHPRRFTDEELRLLATFSEMAGTALRREVFRIETQEKLSQLETLHQIDLAISSSFDLQFTLNVFLKSATRQLKVDAAAILLFNRAGALECRAGRGLPAAMTERVNLRLGDEYAGRVALERHLIRVDNLADGDVPALLQRAIRENGVAFRSYVGAPLIVKGEVKGVFEVFHSAPIPDDPAWLHYLETLAGQAAIAVDSAQLFEKVQRSNLELLGAYETTIEGWSRALDLRDKETEGHTQRVTAMTVRLAGSMGVGSEALRYIRYGALLHDIGKMGVPDAILLKPDKLTPEEWAVMQKHPVFAYEMLLPIEYLHPALDIPYCHHEKWDGTGYPRGLQGEAIPLAARIFAVIDVWDALTSDRPYRKAWTPEQAVTYIREQAGRHFDPAVTEAFLKHILETG